MQETLRDKIVTYLQTADRTCTAEQIASDLELNGRELQQFWPLLEELKREFVIGENKKGYRLLDGKEYITGTFAANARGFGFITPSDGGEDVYVAAKDVHGALHGDTVQAHITTVADDEKSKRNSDLSKAEAVIVRIVERADSEIIGTYTAGRGFGFVTPDDSRWRDDIFVPSTRAMQAATGMKVVVKITAWPETKRRIEGAVTEVLGKTGAPGVDILSIMRKHGLKEEFPPAVEREIVRISDNIPAVEYQTRIDRRDFPIVTIDGEDAKDLDDGVFAVRLPNGGYRLGVYIADVSWYVRENQPLDKEARERGTSVYLADRVIPMLPRKLSNGVCSLNAGEDRLAMACEMEFTARGRLVRYDIFPALIRVYRRLTYKLANKILAQKSESLLSDNLDIVPHLTTLADLRRVLKAKHARKGAIDFALPEIKVKLDAKGHPVGLIKRQGGLAESIIEECMLAANEVVAEHLAKHKIPGLYRVHEPPTQEKTERLNNLLALFGLYVPVGQRGIKPKDVQKVLRQIVGRPEERLIFMVSLRSMQQARYSARNLGHFGLAAKYYTHFTSPIRRYPDLIVHRVLKETLTVERRAELKALLPDIADLSSARERRAVEAERETAELKQAEYMEQFIGEDFSGIISGVTNFGLFVELDNGVEGMVHIRSLDGDYYEFAADKFALIGGHSRRQFTLGDEIEVTVVGVDLAERKIDLRLAEGANTQGSSRSARKKKKNTIQRQPIVVAKTKSQGKKMAKEEKMAEKLRRREFKKQKRRSRRERKQKHGPKK